MHLQTGVQMRPSDVESRRDRTDSESSCEEPDRRATAQTLHPPPDARTLREDLAVLDELRRHVGHRPAVLGGQLRCVGVWQDLRARGGRQMMFKPPVQQRVQTRGMHVRLRQATPVQQHVQTQGVHVQLQQASLRRSTRGASPGQLSPDMAGYLETR